MPSNSHKKASRKAKILSQFSIFSRKKPLLDLLEIQRKSFFDLLEHGIPHELAKIGVFQETAKNSTFTRELELTLNPETYKFISPTCTPRQAILKGKTYACKLYVQATLVVRSGTQKKNLSTLPVVQKKQATTSCPTNAGWSGLQSKVVYSDGDKILFDNGGIPPSSLQHFQNNLSTSTFCSASEGRTAGTISPTFCFATFGTKGRTAGIINKQASLRGIGYLGIKRDRVRKGLKINKKTLPGILNLLMLPNFAIKQYPTSFSSIPKYKRTPVSCFTLPLFAKLAKASEAFDCYPTYGCFATCDSSVGCFANKGSVKQALAILLSVRAKQNAASIPLLAYFGLRSRLSKATETFGYFGKNSKVKGSGISIFKKPSNPFIKLLTLLINPFFINLITPTEALASYASYGCKGSMKQEAKGRRRSKYKYEQQASKAYENVLKGSGVIKQATHNVNDGRMLGDINELKVRNKDAQIFRPWIFLGELPLMTKRGHFILNGSPRVIVNQTARCPGIYFQEKRRGVGFEQEIRVSADLIPQRGPWLRIQSDWEGRFWARLKQEGRVKYATLYEAFKEFEKQYNAPLVNLLATNSSQFLKSEIIAFQERKTKEDRQKNALIRLFKNSTRYSLGKIGRFRINQRVHFSPFYESIRQQHHNGLPSLINLSTLPTSTFCFATFASVGSKAAEGRTTGTINSTLGPIEGIIDETINDTLPLQSASCGSLPSCFTVEAKGTTVKQEASGSGTLVSYPYFGLLPAVLPTDAKVVWNKKQKNSRKEPHQVSEVAFLNLFSPKETNHLLMAKDIDAIHTCLERLLEGQGFTDDIDHLKNRFIRTSGKLLQQQFELGLQRLNEVIKPLLGNLLQGHLAFLKDSSDLKNSKNGTNTLTVPTSIEALTSYPKEASKGSVRQTPAAASQAKAASLPTDAKVTASFGTTVKQEAEREWNKVSEANTKTQGGILGHTSTTLGTAGVNGDNVSNSDNAIAGTEGIVAPFRWLRTSKPVNGAFREFFGSNPLSQYMDQTNPLAEITHKRRLSSMGPGGIKRETAGMEVRGIHPTHYGRVCPIETPEGKNAGLVNSPTVYSRVGQYGFMETPLYQVSESQVQMKKWAFFSAQQEEDEKSSLGTCDTGLLPFNFLIHTPIPVQTANNPLAHFQQVERSRVGYRALSPVQTISIATALIPFLEHDDANRALMGSNMQRQAIPLLLPERPIVGTGFEPLALIESGQALQATKLGCVSHVNANNIIVHSIYSTKRALPQSVLRNTIDNAFINKISSADLIENKRGINAHFHFRHLTGYSKNLTNKEIIVNTSVSLLYKKTVTGQSRFHRQIGFKSSYASLKDIDFYATVKQEAKGFINVVDRFASMLSLGTAGSKPFASLPAVLPSDAEQKVPKEESQEASPKASCFTIVPFASTVKQEGNEPQDADGLVNKLAKRRRSNSNSIAKTYHQFFYVTKTKYTLWCNFLSPISAIPAKKLQNLLCTTFSPLGTGQIQVPYQLPVVLPSAASLPTDAKVANQKVPQVGQQLTIRKQIERSTSWDRKVCEAAGFCTFLRCLQYLQKIQKRQFEQAQPASCGSLPSVESKGQQGDVGVKNFASFGVFKIGHYVASQFTNVYYLAKAWDSKKSTCTLDLLWHVKKPVWKKHFVGLTRITTFGALCSEASPALPASLFSYLRFFLRTRSKRYGNKTFISCFTGKAGSHRKQASSITFGTAPLLPSAAFPVKQEALGLASFGQQGAKGGHFFLGNCRQQSKRLGKQKTTVGTSKPIFAKEGSKTSWIVCGNTDKMNKKTAVQVTSAKLMTKPMIKLKKKGNVSGVNEFLSLASPSHTNSNRLNIEPSNYYRRYDNSYVSEGLLPASNEAKGLASLVSLGTAGSKPFAWHAPQVGQQGALSASVEAGTLFLRNNQYNEILSISRKIPHKTITRSHLCSSHNLFLLKPFKQTLQLYQRSNQETCLNQRPLIQEGHWVEKGDFLADCSASHSGDLALGKNVTVAYMPWEGYNFEDAIVISDRLISDDVYTSLHIERYEIKVNKNSQGKERITNRIPGTSRFLKHLDSSGIARISSWVQPGDILVGKVVELKRPLSPYERLAWELASRLSPASPEREKWLNKVWLEDISLRLPPGVCGRVVNSQIVSTEWSEKEQYAYPLEVHIYLAVKRKIQVGDKLAGRHGNKGIVSTILPQQDMPYLGDGTSIDMILNPLGVPSRMNLGQIFECLLGLAGSQLGCNFKITPFDEVAGGEASRSLVFLKLYQCRLMYKQQWLFTPTFPGKSKLFDGRTGEPFENWVTVGQAYMLKLIHMVDHKIHARSTGPYSLFTRQPVRGRSRRGGQRLGEMEVWAVEGFGAAYTLQEFLTIKSDDLKARTALQRGFYKQNDVTFGKIHIAPGNPEAFKVLVSELQALCLHIQM